MTSLSVLKWMNSGTTSEVKPVRDGCFTPVTGCAACSGGKENTGNAGVSSAPLSALEMVLWKTDG